MVFFFFLLATFYVYNTQSDVKICSISALRSILIVLELVLFRAYVFVFTFNFLIVR